MSVNVDRSRNSFLNTGQHRDRDRDRYGGDRKENTFNENKIIQVYKERSLSYQEDMKNIMFDISNDNRIGGICNQQGCDIMLYFLKNIDKQKINITKDNTTYTGIDIYLPIYIQLVFNNCFRITPGIKEVLTDPQWNYNYPIPILKLLIQKYTERTRSQSKLPPNIFDIFQIFLNTRRCDLYTQHKYKDIYGVITYDIDILFLTIILNHTRVVELIVDSKQYDVDKPSGDKRLTPLMWAINQREALSSNLSDSNMDFKEETDYGGYYQDNEDYDEDYDEDDDDDDDDEDTGNIFHVNDDIFNKILNNTKNFGAKDNHNQTLLMYAIRYINQPDDRFERVFTTLIDSKQSKPESVDNNKNNALLYLCSRRHLKAKYLHMLISTGQSHPEIIDRQGNSTLMILLQNKSVTLEMVKILLETNLIKLNQTNHKGINVRKMLKKLQLPEDIVEYFKNKYNMYDSLPTLESIISSNEIWLNECAKDGHILSSELYSYYKKILSDLKLESKPFSSITKKELCSQLQAYQQYLIFNQKNGKKRFDTYSTQKTIFNNKVLGDGFKSVVFKSFPFNHNGLPLIFTLRLRGLVDKFKIVGGLYFQTEKVVSSLGPSSDDDNDNDTFRDYRIFKIHGSKRNDSSIFIDLFWTMPQNLSGVSEYSNYTPQLKGVGKRCFCLLFKYILDSGYVTPTTVVKLDASGTNAIKNKNFVTSIENNETALRFVQKYSEPLYLHLQSLLANDQNILPAPYSYYEDEQSIDKYLYLVYENIKLVKYYQSMGFNIDDGYYQNISKDFDPLYVRLTSKVSDVLNSCSLSN
jgi:hypothetical protein